jgi:hypothetical protein
MEQFKMDFLDFQEFLYKTALLNKIKKSIAGWLTLESVYEYSSGGNSPYLIYILLKPIVN